MQNPCERGGSVLSGCSLRLKKCLGATLGATRPTGTSSAPRYRPSAYAVRSRPRSARERRRSGGAFALYLSEIAAHLRCELQTFPFKCASARSSRKSNVPAAPGP
jgi:hypothetical protein